eukprot:6149182-Alexandrium_andersonii.AAC.1
MSASLVGSEMCIRDSAEPEEHDRDHHARCVAGLQPNAGSPSITWAQPVSYTHLTLPTICSV